VLLLQRILTLHIAMFVMIWFHFNSRRYIIFDGHN